MTLVCHCQGGTGQRSKVDTETGDLPENLNIGFSGKGSGIYGSFATGKPAARGPQDSQVSPACLLLSCLLSVCCHVCCAAWLME